ncbi:hypothetical protein PR003_g17946 [Phytophthora rubi]|uniref:RxLR effector protein n=1 Tax=Phytophthora rubi TaxID=129364 RepID=A0A6A3K5U7_9STRA|nr:hypothetical protein PR001_g19666 [Phytophthora rubi]KAE9003010.1 hypothetical protein PR002_g17461 [Phytophthora rubi]KAE9319558.1 hypothetical protein PR003_g17946 [Phytophthora rubi]
MRIFLSGCSLHAVAVLLHRLPPLLSCCFASRSVSAVLLVSCCSATCGSSATAPISSISIMLLC